MARTGVFGKLPKAAPDLSSTINALLAEYMAAIDSNMVDAWKNGGEVDGKAVTDARLLAHFKARRNELDPIFTEFATGVMIIPSSRSVLIVVRRRLAIRRAAGRVDRACSRPDGLATATASNRARSATPKMPRARVSAKWGRHF